MANYNWSTKIQAYLAKIAGKEVENLPEPTTKEQQLLKEIAENGGSSGGGGGLVVHVNDGTLDKTWQEIHDAMASGRSVVVDYGDGIRTRLVISADLDVDLYTVVTMAYDEAYSYAADSIDAYPSHDDGGGKQ